MVDYLGQTALKMRGGLALLPEVDLQNGMVEFDIAIGPERGFVGLIFRMADDGNYENFYIRPHQPGNPDANQYQPVFNGSASWQLYHGPEYASPTQYRYNEWMPVRVVYAGDIAEVYIDSDEPVLRIPILKHSSKGGAIGISAGNFAPAHFTNFRYTQLANAYQFPAAQIEVLPEAGVVTEWQVSDVFDEATLNGIVELDSDQQDNRTWTSLAAEPTGITNLAQVAAIGEGQNTVFAKLSLPAAYGHSKVMQLGYSDKAKVFVNGALVYSGDNTYLSRDYRYLGTIGLFDSVVLPLKPGENEVWIAVTEAFGGWGIMAKIEPD